MAKAGGLLGCRALFDKIILLVDEWNLKFLEMRAKTIQHILIV